MAGPMPTSMPSTDERLPHASPPGGRDAAGPFSDDWAPGLSSGEERAIRVLNLAVAVLGLIAFLPIGVLIALAIKLSSRGPVLYTQTRIGLDRRTQPARATTPKRFKDLGGKPFKIYKFRTMRVDAEHGTGAVWAKKHDPRVTAIGGALRQYRLDEIPQLWNVIRGEMSVVGPRPERPSIFAELRERIPDYKHRQRALPGITGYAQINLAYDSSIEDVREKLRHDLEFIQKRSLWLEIKIMLQTVPVMLFRRGSR
jgi:lipopolysaccharide/colanic/teichoic acid biosynthesis glycosyltransferase